MLLFDAITSVAYSNKVVELIDYMAKVDGLTPTIASLQGPAQTPGLAFLLYFAEVTW